MDFTEYAIELDSMYFRTRKKNSRPE